MGDTVQPVAERTLRTDGGRLAEQHHESGLEGGLGVLIMAEDSFAHAPDHRGVPPYERSEGSFIALGKEALEKVRIGQNIQFSANDLLAKKLDNPGDSHRSLPLGERFSIQRIISGKMRF